MRQNTSILWLARILALVLVAGLAVLVFYLPVVAAAIVFVALVVFLAIAKAKAQGFWSGVRLFLKEILFGW